MVKNLDFLGENMKKFIKEQKYIILIILISVISLGYIYKDNTIMGHDLYFHIAEIRNMVENTKDFTLVVPNIGYNLGYGTYIFYPCLSHVCYATIASVLSIINISCINSILITNVLTSIISGIGMYYLALRLTKSKKQAFISALVYLLFPYRMGNITVRMALAENFAGMFLPFVLLGLVYLFEDNKKKFYTFFTIGYVGLILSHYVMSMFFSIFVFLILIFNIDKLLKNKRMKTLIIGVLAVTILVLPNIAIFAQHYNGDYTIYLDNYIKNPEYTRAETLSGRDLLIPKSEYYWENIPFYIYLPVICFCVYSAFLAIKEHKRRDIIGLICIIICLFLICSESLWKILPDTMCFIQFPWRIVQFLGLFIAMLAPKFLKDDKKLIFIITAILCIVPSFTLINKLATRIYHNDYNVPGRVELETGPGEYYPKKYAYNAKYYENKNKIDIKAGYGNINMIKNTSKVLEFQVSDSRGLEVELPKIYYKGYMLLKDGKKVKVKSNDYGLVTAQVYDGNYKLHYVGTHTYNFCYIIRMIFVFNLINMFWIDRKNKKIK